MLADPAERLRLLIAQYALEHGPDATLPEVAALTPPADGSNDKKKKGEPVPPPAPEAVDAAITALTAALSSGGGAPEADLKALGQARAHAIQDALLASGQIDPSRVFLVAVEPTAATESKVRVELRLK